jgi:hypothetical protein
MRHLSWIIAMLLIGGLVTPLAAYIGGSRLAGPYAGPRGFASYLEVIYADAARGQPLALLILLAPLSCWAVWMLRARVQRYLAAHEDDPAD